jgi:glycosyltransferase involved in cell wall biosynthesis
MVNRGVRPRRILYVQRTGGGGSLIHVLLLVKNLDRELYDPIVLFFGPNPYESEFREAGAEVRMLDSAAPARSGPRPRSGRPQSEWRTHSAFEAARRMKGFVRRDWPLARRLAGAIREVRPDLVQSNLCPSADRATILGAALARVPQVHYSQFFTADGAWLDRSLSVFVDRYLCNSEAVRLHLLSAGGIPERKTRVVYGPFEFPTLSVGRETNTVRESLGANGQHTLIANVGRIVPWKGQDVFLRAFAAIAPRYPKARALVVGGPGDNDAGRAYEADLHKLASDLDLGDSVIFTGHRRDIDDVMAASDVVVHSSSKPEPLGRVVMEGIALMKPVIATGAGGVPEMVEDGVTGSLVPPGDWEAMAEAIDSVLADPPRALIMATRAHAASAGRFSTGAFVRLMESEYRRVLRC